MKSVDLDQSLVQLRSKYRLGFSVKKYNARFSI